MMIEPVIPTMLLANGNVNGHFFITTSFIYFIEVDVSRLLCHFHDFPSHSFSANFAAVDASMYFNGSVRCNSKLTLSKNITYYYTA